MTEMNDRDVQVIVNKLSYLFRDAKLLSIGEYQYNSSEIMSKGVWVAGGGQLLEALYENLGLDRESSIRYTATDDNEKVFLNAVVLQVSLDPDELPTLAMSGLHLINPYRESIDSEGVRGTYELFGLTGGYDRRSFELNKGDTFDLPYITYSQGFIKNASPYVKTYLICSDYLEPGFLA